MKTNFEILKDLTEKLATLDERIEALEKFKKSLLDNLALKSWLKENNQEGNPIDELILQLEEEIERSNTWRDRFLARQHKKALQKIKRLEASIKNLEDHYEIFADTSDKYKSHIMHSIIEESIRKEHPLLNEETLHELLERTRLGLLNYFPSKTPWCMADNIQKKVDAASNDPVIIDLLEYANNVLSQRLYGGDVQPPIKLPLELLEPAKNKKDEKPPAKRQIVFSMDKNNDKSKTEGKKAQPKANPQIVFTMDTNRSKA